MGDNFLLRQIGNFRKRRNLAMADMVKPVLYERPQSISTVFTVKPLAEERCENGEALLVLPDNSEERVAVVRGHRKIGYVDGDGGKILRDTLTAPNSAGMTAIRVLNVSTLSGMAKVQVLAS